MLLKSVPVYTWRFFFVDIWLLNCLVDNMVLLPQIQQQHIKGELPSGQEFPTIVLTRADYSQIRSSLQVMFNSISEEVF